MTMATIFEFPYRTVVEISLRLLLKNLATLRTLGRKEVIPVVKADAYGHGMVPIARTLVGSGSCQMLAVATLEEALELRECLRSPSILVLSGFFPHQMEAYSKHHLTLVAHSLHQLKHFLGRKTLPAIHLKVDSGMNRLGITETELPEAIRILEKVPIKLAGVASHFAESENSLSDFSDKQLVVFENFVKELLSRRLLQTDARIHIGNSGAILRDKLSFSNAVRPGLSLYGISPNPRLGGSESLVPILRWKTRVLALKNVKRGASVGYGRTYHAKKEEQLAILPIGYADGFPRLLSGQGFVLLGGKRCPIRGRVSMDLTAVDVSHYQDGKEGNLVTLIGRDGKEEITAWEIAQWAQTIPYEIFCGLSPRVPRIYSD